MNISEDNFIAWSKGPSDTETTKCENAENAVRKAIKANSDLQNLDIKVFAQGSYKSRTNIRLDSDVDICVCCYESFFGDYPNNTTSDSFGHTSATLKYSDFKDMVESALKSYFGKDGVTRGNKAFDIHANSYRIDADVVPTFEHRRYTGETNSDCTDYYLSGVGLKPDKGDLIKNWPDQHYNNGISRNSETGRNYKRVIRILKRLRNKMQEDKIPEASNIASF
ncbi:MAG TPA: nucleotidyltransferase, partial [Verrucomicrobiales bacterium]|nr:nucleotidyltransferase [Verrucomicrobiales bacterium]